MNHKNSYIINKSKQKGSATVEAAIILPLVMFAILSILSIIQITSTYERMQHALNRVATELSQYSYLYAVSGIKQQHDTLGDNIGQAKDELLAKQEMIETFYKSIQNLSNDVNLPNKSDENTMDVLIEIINSGDNFQNSFDELVQNVGDILEDPMGELQIVSLALLDTYFSESKTALFTAISKNMIRRNLSNELGVSNQQLGNKLRINGGIKQLDFSSSTFFNDKETIDIIVEYTVKPMPDFLFLPEIRLRNRACVLAWTWGIEKNSIEKNEDEISSIWNINTTEDARAQHLARGNKIEKLFAGELKQRHGENADITPYKFKTVDLIEYASISKDGSLVTIFSLNPFLPTYSKKSTVIGMINRNLHKLRDFEHDTCNNFTIDVSLLSGNYKRVVYIVVPENEMLPENYIEAFEDSKKTANRLGIELLQVQKYGEFHIGGENE